MILGRRAPGGAGVVDEDVDVAQLRDGFVGEALHLGGLARIGSDPLRGDAARPLSTAERLKNS